MTKIKSVIELAPDDDFVSMRSRLEWTNTAQILMVIPAQNKALQNLVQMKLLARAADDLNIKLALLSQDPRILDLAEAANVDAFTSTRSAKRFGYLGETVKKVNRRRTESPVVKTAEKDTTPRVRVQNRKLVLVVGRGRINFWQQLLSILLIGITGLGLILGVLAIAPAATITLTPTVDPIATQITVTADPAPEVTRLDAANGIIPARAVQVEITLFDEVPTIDTESTPQDFALGEVVFFNRTQDEQIIPISTTLRTSSGVPIEFLTVQTTTIPPGTGATTTTQVIAVEPGPIGNVTSGQINRFANPILGLQARLINETPTDGGTIRQAGVVTEDDKDRVRSKLRQVIQQTGFEMMQDELPLGQFIPPESLQVIELDLTFDKFSGDVAETFGGEMRAVVRGTAVDSANANQLAYLALIDEVPDRQEILARGLAFSAGGVSEVSDRAVTFPVMVEGLAVSELDPELVRNVTSWMPIGEAQAWLNNNLPLVTVPGVEVAPDWLGRLPLFSFRTNVIIRDVDALLYGEQ
ncbi:MAG: baseplate J/gp47 family protein [Chloroflexota bacterium]